MKLTHERVRALRSMLTDLDVPRAGGLAPQHETARALCDEWLARNAAQWDEEEPETLRCGGWFGHVRRSRHGLGYAWFAFSPDDESGPLTEAKARAWLEEQAREAGYEVEGSERC